MKALAIGDCEIGAIYKIGQTHAFFFSVNSSYYCNHMEQNTPVLMSFKEFKELYPNHVHSNLYHNFN